MSRTVNSFFRNNAFIPDVKVSDNYFDLVTGEEKVVEVITDGAIDFDAGMKLITLNSLKNQ